MTAHALDRDIRPRLQLVDQTGDDSVVVKFPKRVDMATKTAGGISLMAAGGFYDRLYRPQPSYHPIGRRGMSLDQIALGIAAITAVSVFALIKKARSSI